jgi:hypothetical protein
LRVFDSNAEHIRNLHDARVAGARTHPSTCATLYIALRPLKISNPAPIHLLHIPARCHLLDGGLRHSACVLCHVRVGGHGSGHACDALLRHARCGDGVLSDGGLGLTLILGVRLLHLPATGDLTEDKELRNLTGRHLHLPDQLLHRHTLEGILNLDDVHHH